MAADPDPYFALPKLYGAPAYARPPRVVPESERPLDPDDLPIAAEQTEEERALTAMVFGPADPRLSPVPTAAPGAAGPNGGGPNGGAPIHGGASDHAGAATSSQGSATASSRRFSLRALAGRRGSASK